MSCDCRNGTEMWRTAEGIHLDVRGLEPPQPMVKILGLIDSGDVNDVLTVHLDREPIFLYPVLDDRGWAMSFSLRRAAIPPAKMRFGCG